MLTEPENRACRLRFFQRYCPDILLIPTHKNVICTAQRDETIVLLRNSQSSGLLQNRIGTCIRFLLDLRYTSLFGNAMEFIFMSLEQILLESLNDASTCTSTYTSHVRMCTIRDGAARSLRAVSFRPAGFAGSDRGQIRSIFYFSFSLSPRLHFLERNEVHQPGNARDGYIAVSRKVLPKRRYFISRFPAENCDSPVKRARAPPLRATPLAGFICIL